MAILAAQKGYLDEDRALKKGASLRIGIDSSRIFIGKGRGGRRYILHLFKTLALSPATHRYFMITSEGEEVTPFLPSHSRFACVSPKRYFFLRRWPWLGPAAKAFTPRIDVMHFINTIWENYPGKCLVTLGDLAPYHFPERLFMSSEEEAAYRHNLKVIVERGMLIATHSEYSRQDIITHLKVSPDLVRVVYPIVDPVFLEAQIERQTPENPYFLFVGGIDFRKNIPLLLEAFSLYRERGGRSELFLVGRRDARRPKPYIDLQPLLDAMKEKEHVRWLTAVSDEELVPIYASSNALVFPSFFEGFGSPLVEAMACETPIITVRKACMPEVVGEAGYYAETTPESLAAAMTEVENNQNLKNQLIASGKKRIDLYQPERFAAEMVSIYEEAAGRK